MNLNKLRDKAYQCAVAHGWHEENLSDEHFLCAGHIRTYGSGRSRSERETCESCNVQRMARE